MSFDECLRHAVCVDGKPTTALWTLLETIPSEEAERKLPHLLTLASLVIDNQPPTSLPDGWDEAAVRTFVVNFVQTSAFVDRLVDASLLSPCARRLKWKAEQRAASSARDAQQRRRRAQVATSAGNLRCVERNARAFANVSPDVRNANPVLSLTLEQLRRQSPAFWTTVRLDGADELVLRAVLHRVRSYRERFGGTALPESARKRFDDRFAALASVDAESAIVKGGHSGGAASASASRGDATGERKCHGCRKCGERFMRKYRAMFQNQL